MFIDYLKLTFKIPHDPMAKKHPGYHHALVIYKRSKIAGEMLIDKSHRTTFQNQIDGILVVMDWGGSVIEIDNNDFLRQFKKYKGWNISRLDIAENITHVARSEARSGQVKNRQDYTDPQSGAWTGCTLGIRGKAGSYYRIYDARKHDKGKAAKVARFGRYDFWRSEYELSREFLRRNGINTFDQLTVELLENLWANETMKKGVLIKGTSGYKEINQHPSPEKSETENEAAERMAQESRYTSIMQMVNKLDAERLALLKKAVAEILEKKLDIPDSWPPVGPDPAVDEMRKRMEQFDKD